MPSIALLLEVFKQPLCLPLSGEAGAVHCSNVMHMGGLPSKQNNRAHHAMRISAFLESTNSNMASLVHRKLAF